MPNTTKKVYQWLRQIDNTTGLPTGVRKPNDPADIADYVAPVTDLDKCPLPITWEAVDPFCIQNALTCPTGYTLSPDGSTCIKTTSVPSTPPSGSGTFKVVAAVNGAYSINGTRIYTSYDSNGNGTYDTVDTTNAFWRNLPANTTSGPLNRCGVWGDNNNDGSPDPISNQWIGFSIPININNSRAYYVGIAGDNAARISVDGTTIVEQVFTSVPVANFRTWHIYRIELIAGPHFIELEGIDDGAVSASFGAEIYDTDDPIFLAGVTGYYNAVTNPNGVKLIFSTKDSRGGTFQTGTTGGYSCGSGYSLDTSVFPPQCTLIQYASPTGGNTGDKGWANRIRLLGGTPDGYEEANTEFGGQGPYFPPVQDLTSCPVDGTPLQPFDYLVVRYIWTTANGRDLDTFTGLINTSTIYDNDWVGYGQGDTKVPAGSATPYLQWAQDNTTTSGVEAILVNFKKFIEDNPSVGSPVTLRMNAVWFGERVDGNIQIQLATYLGGTMQLDAPNFNFINVGGVAVDTITLPTNVVSNNQLANISSSDDVGQVRYDKITKQAVLQLI